MSFIFLTDFFESSALALNLKYLESKDVKVIVSDKNYSKILSGLIDKESDYIKYLGKNNIFITDNASSGKLSDSLRKKGELVFGGNEESDRLENDRSYGQEIMRQCGIATKKSYNFKGHQADDKAIDFIMKHPKKWVIKQNGEADKSLSYVGKFDNGIDVIDRLDDMKVKWSEGEEIDFDLMEFIDGHVEVGCSAWFNGSDFLRDKNGEIVWELNWEHKKLDGDTGTTTGETGTLAYRSTKNSRLGKEMLKTLPFLKKIKYIGNLDINFIIGKDDKAYGLEWSMRFGYPFLGIQQEMMKNSWSELIEGCVKGKNNFLSYNPRWAVVVVLQAPPFPFQSEVNNSKGQRLYFLDKGKWTGKDSLSNEKLRHIQPYELKFDKEDKEFLLTGNDGYVLTVTHQNQTDFKDWKQGIKEANDGALKYLIENVYTPNMHYRKDIGYNQRVIKGIEYLHSRGWI